MNKKAIAGGIFVVMVGVFLGGFLPQYQRASQAAQENRQLQTQLEVSRQAEAISSFRNRAALLYIEAARSNFSVAAGMASKDFTDMRSYADGTTDAGLKQGLNDILTSRDAIIGGLAKADPAVTAQLQDMFLRMQKIQP